MGLFSSKKVTQVGTTVSRVIEDDATPNSVMTGVIKSIFDEGNLSDYIMEELVGSVGVRAGRMYEYGQSTYTHGLPSGQIMSATDGKDTVQTVIEGIEGATIELQYCNIGAPNNLHIGWMALVAAHGYNQTTNQLGGLTAAKGTPVYLKDMVVVVPATMMAEIEPGALAQWGTPATAGYTPERLTNVASAVGRLSAPSPIYADPAATEEHLLVTCVWEAMGTVTLGDETHAGMVIQTGSFTLPISGYLDDADYFHAKYVVGGVTKYWMYQANVGTYPTLDAVFNAPVETNGQYFPFAYFRYNKLSEVSDKTTDTYRTTKRLVKYLGMDFDQLAEAIDENPDIADVEQAMLIMAVPANTTDPHERRYLFDYFDTLYNASTNQFSSTVQASILSRLADEPNLSRSSIVIQDARFKMALSHEGIYKRRVAGSVGLVGTYDSIRTTDTIQQPYTDLSGETPVTATQSITTMSHYFRYQVTEGMYEEIQVVDLRMRYHIYGNYTTSGVGEDAILLIPIDRSISEDYSIPVREILYSRSLHFVFNSRVEIKIKWYQQAWFRAVLIIVAVVLTILTSGATLEALAVAIASGSAVAIAIAVWAIVVKILIGLAIGAVLKLFVKEVGVEFAFIVAIIAAIAGYYQAFEAGSVAGAPWAKELLALASGLAQSVPEVVSDLMSDLMGQASEFNLFIEEQTKLLDTAQALLATSSVLSPFVIFGETPDDYYNRTVHSGNIGILGISAISSYVDVALTLPKLNNTIEGI